MHILKMQDVQPAFIILDSYASVRGTSVTDSERCRRALPWTQSLRSASVILKVIFTAWSTDAP